MLYLEPEEIKDLYNSLSEWGMTIDEPVPELVSSIIPHIKHVSEIPKTSIFGNEMYKSVEEKAAILFYSINKKHIFHNGNKRMSIVCMIAFLRKNQKEVKFTNDDLRDKAIWLAKSQVDDFDMVKDDLKEWIKNNIE